MPPCSVRWGSIRLLVAGMGVFWTCLPWMASSQVMWWHLRSAAVVPFLTTPWCATWGPPAPGEIMRCSFSCSFLWCPYLQATALPSPPKVCFPIPPGARYSLPVLCPMHTGKVTMELCSVDPPCDSWPLTLAAFPPGLLLWKDPGKTDHHFDVFVLGTYSSSSCPPFRRLKFMFLSISSAWAGVFAFKAYFSIRLHPCDLNHPGFYFSSYRFLFFVVVLGRVKSLFLSSGIPLLPSCWFYGF